MFRSGEREWHAMQVRKSCAPRLASGAGVSALAPSAMATVAASANKASLDILASRHADDAHHPAFLVVEDVAVKHPVAGVVGDKGDLGPLAWRVFHRVPPPPVPGVPGGPGSHAALAASDVHRGMHSGPRCHYADSEPRTD